jgi:hypothetical protein
MREFSRHLLALAFLALILPELARACTCSEPGPAPCRLLQEASLVFLGTVVDIENPPNSDPKVEDRGLSRYHFRVDERFAGTRAEDLDIYSGRGGADCSYHFLSGQQYLVFAYKDDKGRLSTGICSRTQPAAQAQILLTTLRAIRDGQEVPSLFGVLWRTQSSYGSAELENYDAPLVNKVVRLKSQTNAEFSSVTDQTGAYAFYGLPAGNYQVSADLGASHLKMGESSLALPAHACYPLNIFTVPATRIQGHVVAPDGHNIETGVELFLAGKYSSGRGEWEYSKGDEGFQFNGIAPGDYVLVFNNGEHLDPDAPFPRTFYPAAPDLARAAPIHVTEGDEVINADIHLPNGRETRKLSVRLMWLGVKKPDIVLVSASGSEGRAPFAQQISPEHYELTLLRGVRYEINASQDCGMRVSGNTATPIGAVHSSSVVLEPENPATEVTLVFPAGPCKPYEIPKSLNPTHPGKN